MKQAIQEGFILDVLAHYTPVASYYRLAKTVEDDPEFDARRAQKKLRRFVEGSDHAIRLNYVDKTLAGVRADEQTVADVVTGKLNVRGAAAELPEDDVAGDAEEPADEYTIEQEVTV